MEELKPWENFSLAFLAFNVVPMLPAIIELLLAGSVDEKTLVLTTAIYSASMLSCTRNVLFMGCYILISVLQCVLFGAMTDSAFEIGQKIYSTYVCLVLILGSHLFERYKLHFVDTKNFWGE